MYHISMSIGHTDSGNGIEADLVPGAYHRLITRKHPHGTITLILSEARLVCEVYRFVILNGFNHLWECFKSSIPLSFQLLRSQSNVWFKDPLGDTMSTVYSSQSCDADELVWIHPVE